MNTDRFIPKDGDFIKITSFYGIPQNKYIAIYHCTDKDGKIYTYATLCIEGYFYENDAIIYDDSSLWKDDIEKICLATENEKKILLDKIHNDFKKWDADKNIFT